jgi:hypothetical protein
MNLDKQISVFFNHSKNIFLEGACFCKALQLSITILIIGYYGMLSAANDPPNRGLRINFGPNIGIYNVNTKHAQNPSAQVSALLGFRKEIRLNKEYRAFFLVGVEYFFHGLKFKSYFFKPDSLALYNRVFAYTYKVFIQEGHLPLQLKYSFNRENNSLFSPYVMLGYHLRFLLPAKVKVSDNGNTVQEGFENLRFRNYLGEPRISSFASISLGWQKNILNNSKNGFFVETNFRYGFSQYFFETNYAASSLYINGIHLSLILGLRF